MRPKARALSVEFKALGAKDKKTYTQLAQKDKERYQNEMADYIPPSDESDDDHIKKKQKKKDPNKPKRNLSAFFIYSNAVREDVRKENPEAKFGDIARVCFSVTRLFITMLSTITHIILFLTHY